MSESTSDLELITRRIRDLERQNRRIRAAAAVMTVACLAVFLMGQSPPGDPTIQATEIVLLDGEGNRAGVLKAAETGPGIALNYANGEMAVFLGLVDGRPSISFFDSAGQPRTQLGCSRGPGKDWWRLMFRDEMGTGRLDLGLYSIGPGVSLADADDITRAVLVVSEDKGPMFEIRDANKAPVFSAP